MDYNEGITHFFDLELSVILNTYNGTQIDPANLKKNEQQENLDRRDCRQALPRLGQLPQTLDSVEKDQAKQKEHHMTEQNLSNKAGFDPHAVASSLVNEHCMNRKFRNLVMRRPDVNMALSASNGETSDTGNDEVITGDSIHRCLELLPSRGDRAVDQALPWPYFRSGQEADNELPLPARHRSPPQPQRPEKRARSLDQCPQ